MNILLEEAKKLIKKEQKVNISFLQRHLQLTYSQAKNIIDELETLGLIGKYNGFDTRQIFID